jgi:hypothetical protein
VLLYGKIGAFDEPSRDQSIFVLCLHLAVGPARMRACPTFVFGSISMEKINELSAATRECVVSLKALTAAEYAQNLNQVFACGSV